MQPRRFFVGKTIGFILLVVIVLLVGGFYWLNNYIYIQKQGPGPQDYKNVAYLIEGKPVTLVNGVSVVEAAPNSDSTITTTYFGNLAKGDLNGDTIPDLAFLLTQTTGGSGTFYYVVAAIQQPGGGYVGTNAVLLGDRIAPQTTEITNGELVVNYADRGANEPMTTPPSVGVSKYLKIQNGSLVQAR